MARKYIRFLPIPSWKRAMFSASETSRLFPLTNWKFMEAFPVFGTALIKTEMLVLFSTLIWSLGACCLWIRLLLTFRCAVWVVLNAGRFLAEIVPLTVVSSNPAWAAFFVSTVWWCSDVHPYKHFQKIIFHLLISLNPNSLFWWGKCQDPLKSKFPTGSR